MQEVLLRVVEQGRKQDIANPLAYAYRVADSVIFADARRRAPEIDLAEQEIVSDLPAADQQLQDKERHLIFERALRNLTPLQREVFIKRHLDGTSRQDIARDMRMSVEAVKKHLLRAMAEMAAAATRSDSAPWGESGEGRKWG